MDSIFLCRFPFNYLHQFYSVLALIVADVYFFPYKLITFILFMYLSLVCFCHTNKNIPVFSFSKRKLQPLLCLQQNLRDPRDYWLLGFADQKSLWVCKRGEGGHHGLQLLLLCPQNHLPGCGWEGAKGGYMFLKVCFF